MTELVLVLITDTLFEFRFATKIVLDETSVGPVAPVGPVKPVGPVGPGSTCWSSETSRSSR